MTNFIELERRFSTATDKDRRDSEVQAEFDEHLYGDSLGWQDLLGFPRVVLLAEAGSGKTDEMRARKRCLVAQGKAAFFVPLELLPTGLESSLEYSSDLDRFCAWKQNGEEPGWFFLDALDELKLSGGRLHSALVRFSHELRDHFDRTRVLISCRASDWGVGDSDSLVHLLIRNKVEDSLRVRLAVREDSQADGVVYESVQTDNEDNPVQDDNSNVKTVIMHPLSNEQIRRFSGQSELEDWEAFLGEVDAKDAWTFARRPLDLKLLMAIWKQDGTLGTKERQHETNVTIKLDEKDPDRADSDVLSNHKARQGAERLALALTLTRTRTVRTPDQSVLQQLPNGILEPSAILPDWSQTERRALLRKAIFDPATFGRVRFHHATVQEYLVARRLRKLREKGMSIKALFRLLFTEAYRQKVVFLSMRQVAAWLALWDNDVWKEMIEREPEALLSLGDPESLELAKRCNLVREFANRYGNGGWTGLHVPIGEVRRIAHPGLETVIRECWAENPANIDVREFLIRLVRFGPVKDCADLVLEVATDPDEDPVLRIDAILAMLGCGETEKVKKLADDMLTQTSDWPARVVHGISQHLFPEFIDADGLVLLMERTTEPSKTRSGGFEWCARQIVDEVEPGSKPASSLRDGMANLIWKGYDRRSGLYSFSSKFDHLSPALAKLCVRQLAECGNACPAELIRASVIASRFSDETTSSRNPVNALREHYGTAYALRSEGFWAELAFMDDAIHTADDWVRFCNVNHDGLIGHLIRSDRKWLGDALADKNRPGRRGVALHALISLRWQGNQDQSELEDIRARIDGDSGLAETLERLTAPPTPEKEAEAAKQEAKNQERQNRREDEKAQWQKAEAALRSELVMKEPDAFSPAKRASTLLRLYQWLREKNESHGPLRNWDRDALADAFGADVADRAGEALKAYWRAVPPVLWSQKPGHKRNLTHWQTLLGLLGVSTEASSEDWPASLSPDDARTAAAYATLELNEFPQYVSTLAELYPRETEEVIGGEVSAELRLGDECDHLPTLQNLTYADHAIRQLCVPRLLVELKYWPQVIDDTAGKRGSAHLARILRILTEATNGDDKSKVVQKCLEEFRLDPAGPQALAWLKGLFISDAVQGANALIEQLQAADINKDGDYAVGMFACILEWDHSLAFEVDEFADHAIILGKLAGEAYRWVRPEDDVVHEGVYSPNDRDRAEDVRRRLLDMLYSMPGSEAHSVLVELACDSSVESRSDRLKVLARQKAARDADFWAYSPEDVIALETKYEAPAADRDGLFGVMMDRLDDLQHEFNHGDFSDRKTVRDITDETEMQRTLARRLKDQAKGVYQVTREEEVADCRRPDFRLLSANGIHKAAIEVKIADRRWSLRQLETALADQLVGQYLRDADCKAGCLLLTGHDAQKYWLHPETGKRIKFAEMINYLNDRARQIAAQKEDLIKIGVFGLALTGLN